MSENISTEYLPHFLHQVILLLFMKAYDAADFLDIDSAFSIWLENHLTFLYQQYEKKNNLYLLRL